MSRCGTALGRAVAPQAEGDLYPHTESRDCACGPTVEPVGEGWSQVTHNAWDGRSGEEEDFEHLSAEELWGPM